MKVVKTKYHINSKGTPSICRATKGKCPFGGADQHFESQQEAYAHAEKIHKQEAMNPNRRDLPDGFVEVLSESEKNGRKTTTSRQHLDTGDLQTDTYFKGTSRHRDGDEPARVVYDKNGRIHLKEYIKNGHFHRDDGPARQIFNHNGEVLREEWYQNGKLHRTDGAAIVVHNSDGTPKIEEWFQSGQRHRDDGPAKILHSRSFVVEEYFRDDRRHRDGAPAVVSTRSDGRPSTRNGTRMGSCIGGTVLLKRTSLKMAGSERRSGIRTEKFRALMTSQRGRRTDWMVLWFQTPGIEMIKSGVVTINPPVWSIFPTVL